jgi:starvation-inducible DNA-binding protein
MANNFTVPGLDQSAGDEIVALLDQRLVALADLALTLKHIHWNVVGPNFIAVHEMLDVQVEAVREMTDQTAERIATLGGVPVGTPGAIVARRDWDDYSLGKAHTQEHLAALDLAYAGLIADHRGAIKRLDELDLVTQDLLIGHVAQLEQFQWFVRAHLEDRQGNLKHVGATTEVDAADAVRAKEYRAS